MTKTEVRVFSYAFDSGMLALDKFPLASRSAKYAS